MSDGFLVTRTCNTCGKVTQVTIGRVSVDDALVLANHAHGVDFECAGSGSITLTSTHLKDLVAEEPTRPSAPEDKVQNIAGPRSRKRVRGDHTTA